jgi:putative transposase
MSLQGSMTVERLCELARVSRASFYRSLKEQRPAEEETEVRSTIQQIALEHRRRYGYRRICAELRRLPKHLLVQRKIELLPGPKLLRQLRN